MIWHSLPFGLLFGLPLWVPSLLFLIILLYRKSPLWLCSALLLLTVWLLSAPDGVLLLIAALLLLVNLKPLRRPVLSTPLMKMMEKMGVLPAISETEQTAIEAGTVWVEGELFSGRPDFARILSEPWPGLTQKEQAFLDGPVEKLCSMVTDWEIFRRKGLPDEVWEFVRKERFFGLMIPESYGGHGFSHLAHSAIIAKLASRSGPLATTVMVPNSLGPAELLIHYGTERQRKHYLPRLAAGEEIPCFALTEPGAGSDAGAMQSRGVVFRDEEGELRVRLDWEKRYITLASISTLIGLAFKLHDPDLLLGGEVDRGITCALVPSDLEGVELGRRHDPMGIPFQNCPTRGNGVVISIDDLIGGADGAGNGWRMLMESLAVGRGISLPAQASGNAKIAARAIGAYAAVRKQFGLPIGKFEGIEEPMARIGGYNYLMEAARRFTCGGIDKGAKPAVVTAIAKYQFTELGRKIVNDAMDIVGGAGISRGPRNLFAHAYMATPIGITVEGANILTRSLVIFGQGAIRCHPYLYGEIGALMSGDRKAFDDLFWKHLGHVISNAVRAMLLSLTRGRLASAPVRGVAGRWWQRLSWASATFALMADITLGSYGGALKMKEKIAGRFADLLSWMYLATALLRRYEAEGQPEDDRDYFLWAIGQAFHEIELAFDAIFREIEVPGLGWFFRGPVSLWSRINRIGTKPSDRLGHRVAERMQQPGAQRDRMSEGAYLPAGGDEQLQRLERALLLAVETEPLYRRLRQAVKEKKIDRGTIEQQLEQALESELLTRGEAGSIRQTELARQEAIRVDEYTLQEYRQQTPSVPSGPGNT